MNNAKSEFIYHYHNGSSTHAWEFLGCHPETRDGVEGFVFRVWAPNARAVSVVGDFNFWRLATLSSRNSAESFPSVPEYYKY